MPDKVQGYTAINPPDPKDFVAGTRIAFDVEPSIYDYVKEQLRVQRSKGDMYGVQFSIGTRRIHGFVEELRARPTIAMRITRVAPIQ